MQQQQEQSASRPLYTVPNFADKHRTFLTQAALRDQILKAAARVNSRGEKTETNGLAEAGAILRVGRRVLIDEERYFAWLDSRQSNTPVRSLSARQPILSLTTRSEKDA
jgi:hypothetical protein